MIAVIATALLTPRGIAIIPLTVNYTVGEKMIYNTTETVTIQMDNTTMAAGQMGLIPSTTSFNSTESVEVVDFDGEYYTLNHTVTLIMEQWSPISMSPISMSFVEIVNKTGFSSYFFSMGTEQFVFNASGNPFVSVLLARPEVKVGDTWQVPMSTGNSSFGIAGNLTVTFGGIQDITVPAGTYKVFKIDFSSNNLSANPIVLPNATGTNFPTFFNMRYSGQKYLEYQTCREIESNIEVTHSYQIGELNYYCNCSSQTKLMQHLRARNPEYSELTAPEKVLTVLEEVVGLDITKYNTDLEFHAQAPFLYFEVLPQEDVKYILESNESKLEVICAFVDEKLRSLSVYLMDGSPLTTEPITSPIEMAKDFLDKYPEYSEGPYYSTMWSMLDNFEGDKNTSKTVENIKLEVTVTESYTSFRWKYAFKGVEAPQKCVVLKFENGFLDYFIDNWSLFTVGSTDLNISEEEAIEIAMNAAENYSWNVGMGDDQKINVTEFNIMGVSDTTLQIGNYPTKNESRGGDPLTLYPGWRVKLYFDKLYPGNVYGLDIGIWADTGEVNDIRTLISMLVFPDDIPEFPSWIILPLFLMATFVVVIVKKRLTHNIY